MRIYFLCKQLDQAQLVNQATFVVIVREVYVEGMFNV